MPDPVPEIRERVLAATWDWRAPAGPAPGSGRAALRRAALTQAGVTAAVGAVLRFGFGHHLFPLVLWGIAILVLFLGLFLPRAYRPVHAFGRGLGRVVGKILLYVLLVPFYYLFFTPVALLLRLQKRDPLHRSFRDPRHTYWIARGPRERGENASRQFLREDREARGALRDVESGDVGSGEGGR
jgi:hypothetical protein